MAKALRQVNVTHRERLTPNMVRMTIGGESLEDFPEGFEGGYIKLVFPADEKPVVRSYTIRHHDVVSQSLVMDMVAHGDTGPAAAWANRVQPGDRVSIQGPGPCQNIDTTADWFLIAGDMSAIPAISVNLAKLPASARGYVALEVISEADKIDLDLPPGIDLRWIVNPDPESTNSMLEDTVMSLPWLEGRVSAWVAGEFSASRALRQYFRHAKQLPKDQMYVSCYWKIGETDEGMKAAKRADVEAW